ncbi:MAG TPA: hypothetical protein VM889_10435, partial [Candidatus Thermoplasmatota archaeon]|nr:hypothetical protein [Candidatus Thermoplasmatota archaeon]
MSAKLATAAFVLSVLALVGPGSAQWSWSLQWEETETDRLALEAAGQANCVSEVVRAEDPLARCPAEATGWIHPAEGLRVLDDTYVVTGPTHPYKFTGWASTTAKNVEEGRRADYLSIVQMLLDGGNWRQDSEGEMPDIITPGVGNFVALYGWWADLDGDGVAEIKPIYANPGPDNEWVAKGGATVVSYVEPGSRPELTNRAQPGKSDPDIVYVSQGVYRQDYVILFLDGSLLRRTTVTTVADALLSADGEGRPYTADAYSRVDIDVYAALAPGPLEALYGAVAGEISDHYGAPSLGICPARCQP